MKPLRRPMWVWLKFKLTPKGDFCVVNVMACIFLKSVFGGPP